MDNQSFVTWHDAKQQYFIRISATVLSTIERYRQLNKRSPEAGGLLIGEVYGEYGIWVKALTVPAYSDKASRISFIRRDPSHNQLLKYWHEQSGGKMQYLGEWHTHPQAVPSPSGIDLHSWSNLLSIMKLDLNNQPILFFIGSTSSHENDWLSLFHHRYISLIKKDKTKS